MPKPPLSREQIEAEEFYNLCQTYRHAPLTPQDEVCGAYEAILLWLNNHDAALRASLETSMRQQEHLASNVNTGLLEIRRLIQRVERLDEAVRDIAIRAKRIREDKAVVGMEAFYIEQICQQALAQGEGKL